MADEFSHIYMVDLGGNVRNNPKLSGTTHNVFGIQAGVTIAFLVKKRAERDVAGFSMHGARKWNALKKSGDPPDDRSRRCSLRTLSPINTTTGSIRPTTILMSSLLAGRRRKGVCFELYSNGIKTQRDEWVYDFIKGALEQKGAILRRGLSKAMADRRLIQGMQIKWDRELKRGI